MSKSQFLTQKLDLLNVTGWFEQNDMSCIQIYCSWLFTLLVKVVFHINDINDHVSTGSSHLDKLFVIEYFLTRIVKYKQTIFSILHKLQVCEFFENNVWMQVNLWVYWLHFVVEKNNIFKLWIKVVSCYYSENRIPFTTTRRTYHGHKDSVTSRDNFVYNRGFGKIYPTKLDKMEIQTDVSSQVGLSTVNFTMQRTISIKIKTFEQKMQLPTVVTLSGYRISHYFRFRKEVHWQLDQLLLVPSQNQMCIKQKCIVLFKCFTYNIS